VKRFYLGLCGVALAVASLAAQTPVTTYTNADAGEIQGLSAKYASALGACQAEAYAGLFTPDGIFYSSFRGSIKGTGALIALVKSERHCQPGAERPARPGGGTGAPALQFGNIVFGVRTPTTATMRVTLPNNGGAYEDVYTKTAAGWRFANRSHYPPAELAARASGKLQLSSEDVLDIQQLVSRYGYVLDNGAEGGKAYADLFTDDGVFASPQATVSGREALLKFASGHRPGQGPAYVRNFATNVKLEPIAGGARGRVYGVVIAIGENNQPSSVFAGGHFEDTYAKTQAGWRFKRRQFVPSEGGPTSNVGKPTAPAAR
jgi:hypothetical protein